MVELVFLFAKIPVLSYLPFGCAIVPVAGCSACSPPASSPTPRVSVAEVGISTLSAVFPCNVEALSDVVPPLSVSVVRSLLFAIMAHYTSSFRVLLLHFLLLHQLLRFFVHHFG